MVSQARIVINRAAVKAIDMSIVAGLETWAVETLAQVRPPDQPPYGQGLVDRGGYTAYVDGKRVGGDADKPTQTRVRGKGIVVACGFGFPARFQEIGTIHQPARPFLSPVALHVAGSGAAERGARGAWRG